MDRAGRLALLCLVLLVAAVPVVPAGGAWLPVDGVAALALALLGGAALWVEARAGRSRPGLGTPMDAAFGAWLLIALLSALDAERPVLARYECARLLTLGLVWLLAIRTLTTPARVAALLGAALAGAAVVSLTGLWAHAGFVDSGAPETARSGLLSTPFFGHSYLAAQYVLVPLVAGLVLAADRARRPLERAALALLALPSAAFVVVTGSRGALLAVVTALLVSLLLRAGARDAGRGRASRLLRAGGRALVLLVLAAGALLLASRTGLLAGAADDVARRFAALFDAGQAHTSFSRLSLWRAGLELAGEHPFTGVGPGGFGSAVAARHASPTVVPHAHNQFVQVLGEHGVFALLALLALLRAARHAAVRGAALLEGDPARRGLHHALAAALCAALVIACFETPLVWTESGALVVALLAALGRAGCDSRERVASPRARAAGVALVLVVLAVSLPVWWRMVPTLAQGAGAHGAWRDAMQADAPDRRARAEQALARLAAADARFPHHPRLAALGAQIATSLGRLDETLAWHRRALQRVPGAPPHLLGEGRTLLALGRPADAVEPLRRALLSWPRDGRHALLADLARATLGAGRLEQALVCQRELLDAGWHHGHPDLLLDTARTRLWLQRDAERALALLREYTARVPAAAARADVDDLRVQLTALAARGLPPG